MHLAGVFVAHLPRFSTCKVSPKKHFISHGINHFKDDVTQEKIAQEQDAITKAKKREEWTRKRDQVAKAAQCDPLKVQPAQVQEPTARVPPVVDKAVWDFLGGL